MIDETSIAYSLRSAKPMRMGHERLQDRLLFPPEGRPSLSPMTPGAMVATWIALPARSLAALSVKDTTPPLLAAYAARPI